MTPTMIMVLIALWRRLEVEGDYRRFTPDDIAIEISITTEREVGAGWVGPPLRALLKAKLVHKDKGVPDYTLTPKGDKLIAAMVEMGLEEPDGDEAEGHDDRRGVRLG